MIKKLLIVTFLICQTAFASTPLPPISDTHIPLLFEFIPKQDEVKVYALTQCWIGGMDALRARAQKCVEHVARVLVLSIQQGCISPKHCSYVLYGNGNVHQYNTGNHHSNYFLQDIITIKSERNPPPAAPTPSVNKLPQIQGKGLRYAKK